MDTLTLLLIGHVFGTILGVGAATFIEIHLNMGLADRRVMKTDFFVSRVGLVICFLTGLGFVALYIAHGQWFRLYDGVFWAKMLIVAILVLNAYLLHLHKIGLYWGSALSFVSWWSAFLLGMFLSNNVKVVRGDNPMSFVVVMGVYVVMVVAGAWILHKIRAYTKIAQPAPATSTPNTPPTPPSAPPPVATA